MKLLYCVSMVTALLALCEGDSYWPTSWTTAFPVGPGVNLKGKMVTLSQDSGVTFTQPYYQPVPEGVTTDQPDWPTEWPTESTTPSPSWPEWTTTQWPTRSSRPRPTHWPHRTTRWPDWTTRWPDWTTQSPPPTRGVSVCLRFMSDFSSFTLFKLAPRSPLTFSWDNPYYSLRQGYYSSVSLSPRISLSSSIRTQPWTSVCLILDSYKNVVQVFQGGSMSIRKILRSQMVWNGDPVLDMSGFDGQVTDLEVWDYPLKYREISGYMLNYGPSGTVLTWSNIAYSYRGQVLVEETYAQQMSRPISSKEGEKPPIRSEQGRDERRKYKKMLSGKRQRKREMF